MKVFGYEPAVILNALSAVLGLVVTLNVGMTGEQAGLIVGLGGAVITAIAAAMTRPIAPQAFTALVAAVASLLAAYHFDVSPAVVGSVNGLVLAVLTLLVRHQVTPVAKIRDGSAA